MSKTSKKEANEGSNPTVINSITNPTWCGAAKQNDDNSKTKKLWQPRSLRFIMVSFSVDYPAARLPTGNWLDMLFNSLVQLVCHFVTQNAQADSKRKN